MGKRRKTNKHLPERMYLKSGSYYFVDRLNKWHSLGRDYLKAIAEYAKIRGPKGPITTMADLIDRYISEISPSKAESTYKWEVRLSKTLRAGFGKLKPDEITPRTIYQYRDYRGKSGHYQANRELGLLSVMFSQAIEWGVVDRNPCKEVKRFKEKPRDRYVTDEEFLAFREFASPLIAFYLDFKLLTGLRKKDILELRKDQLKYDGVHIVTSKTSKAFIIEWSDELKATVERIKRLNCSNPNVVRFERYLFCTRKGTPYTTDGFSSIWQRQMTKALKQGVLQERFRENDIRAKTGSDIENLTDATGLLAHNSTKTTQRHYRRKTHTAKPLKTNFIRKH